MTDKSFDYIGEYLIVLTECRNDTISIVRNIFRDMWELKIANVNVIVYEDIFDKAVMYTFYPYTAEQCGASEPVVQNRWENGTFIRRRGHYPQKFRNFYRCPIYLSTYHMSPFMILIERDDITNYYTDGFDGIVFRVISQRLNFTPIVIKTPLGGLGDCTSCMLCDCDRLTTSSNALDMVWSRSWCLSDQRDIANNGECFLLQTKSGATNLSIGAIVQTDDRLAQFTASSPYIYLNLVFAIPKGRPYTSFEKLFFPFRWNIWCLLGSVFVIGYVLVLYLRIRLPILRHIIVGSRSRFAAPYLNMVNIFLGGPLLFLPRTRTAVNLAVTWLFATLVLRTAYQGHLFDLLQSDMTYPQVDTMQKIHDSDLLIYSPTTFFNVLYKNVPAYQGRLHVYKPVADSYDVLRDSSFNGVFLTSIEGMAAFNRGHIANGTISITKERVFLLPVSVFFTRSSCLEPVFNEEIHKFSSSGLLFTWAKKFIDLKYVRETRKRDRNSGPRKLSVHQITGILIILFAMHGISLLVFIIELLSIKYVLIQRMLEYL